MTLCSRGRSVLVLAVVFGLVTVSIIPVSTSLRLSLLEYNLRNDGGAGYFTSASLQRRNRAQIGDYISQIGLFQPHIIGVGHRRLERPPIAANAMRDRAPDFLIGPGADAGSRVRRDVGGGARRLPPRCPFARREHPAALAQSGPEIGNALRPSRMAFHAMADGDEIGSPLY